ncbi:NB-ARC domain-containing protein [Saccharopolyspora sp. SCSIO 74807]|uniref:NB-ARC domain-containing protein n=1 Tax=Saccharopolyspora sp. SCSIO 74807 TaxID=3118084 RepID=UPI0030D22E09
MCADEASPVGNSVAGRVHGHVVQTGVVHGGVHLHASQLPVAPPRQWAPPPPHFTNRSAELDELGASLSQVGERGGLITLSGLGGAGKTALALQWLHTIGARFSDGHLYADLTGDVRGPVDPGVVLGGFLRAFGVAGEDLPDGLEQRVGWFRSLLADKKVAILLDNAATAAQVRVLLPPSSQSVVLVTSRRRLGSLLADGARFIHVGPLSTQDGARLLEDTLGPGRIANESEQTEELARLCGGLPIALSVIAARLVTRRRLRVSDVVRALRAEQDRLALLSRDDEVAVEPVFDLSYDALSLQAQGMYRVLGLHPGTEFPLEVAAAATNTPIQHAEDLIDELVEASLVDEVGHDRFRFHDLVRLHARRLAETRESPPAQAQVVLRIAEYYLLAAQATWPVTTGHLRGTDYQCATAPPQVPRFSARLEALEWLDTERASMLATIAAACEHQWWAAAYQLSYALWPLFRFHGHHDDWRRADELAIQAAQALDHAEWEARARRRLAVLEQRVGHHEDAARLLDRCMPLFQSLDDAYGVASIHDARAVLALESGQPQRALEHARRAHEHFTALGHARKIALAELLLGQAHLATGSVDEGLRLMQNGRHALAEFAQQDPFHHARADLVVAQALTTTGDIDAAAPLVDAGSRAMEELRSRPGRALAHRAQADLARARGDLAQARAHFAEAISLFEHLGDATAEVLSRQLDELNRKQDSGPTDPR